MDSVETVETVEKVETICFFGASVTGQKNGYAEKLKSYFKDPTHIFAYGGMHINDAGICFIDDVLKSNPDYCFIDFFSTAYKNSDKITIESLDTIVYKFTQAKCRLIFLFLLKDDHEIRKEFYTFLKAYIEKKHLYYIDLNYYFNYDTTFCRDNVHTTDYGAEQYALKINEIFQANKIYISLPTAIEKTRFCDIKVLEVNKIFTESVTLEGDCLIVGFYLNIGLKSGILDVNGTKQSIWDIHCHYNRRSIKIGKKLVKNNLHIKVLQDKIDYSTCRRPIEETDICKELEIINIYYIGDSLQVC